MGKNKWEPAPHQTHVYIQWAVKICCTESLTLSHCIQLYIHSGASFMTNSGIVMLAGCRAKVDLLVTQLTIKAFAFSRCKPVSVKELIDGTICDDCIDIFFAAETLRVRCKMTR